jgi:hypothetical protein
MLGAAVVGQKVLLSVGWRLKDLEDVMFCDHTTFELLLSGPPCIVSGAGNWYWKDVTHLECLA